MSTSPETHSNSFDKSVTLHDNRFAANHLDCFTLTVRCEMGFGMLSWPLACLNNFCGNFSNACCLAVTVLTMTEGFQIVTGKPLILFLSEVLFQALILCSNIEQHISIEDQFSTSQHLGTSLLLNLTLLSFPKLSAQ